MRYGISVEEATRRILEVSEVFGSGQYAFTPFKPIKRRGKVCQVASNFEDALVLRKLNDNLRRLYKVKQADRSIIVRQVAKLIEEELPMAVILLDIRDFYESIPLGEVLEKVGDEHLLSSESNRLIAVLRSAETSQASGLPRGICVSATLAELFMRDFDARVRRLDGVYFYARFVDDIIVFTYRDGADVWDRVVHELPHGLRPKQAKTHGLLEIKACLCQPVCQCIGPCRCVPKCRCSPQDAHAIALEYLGYRIERLNLAKSSTVTVSIAGKKVKRIKSRIVRALLAYMTDRDFALLESRIKFLTGNYRANWANARSKLKAGIYYSYPLVTNVAVLDELTRFLCRNVFAARGSYGRRLSAALTMPQRKRLAAYSFRFGFEKRVTHRFSADQIRAITRCWSDV
jgi:hypothetical protein